MLQVYDDFLRIERDFGRKKDMDNLNVIAKVLGLFKDHSELVETLDKFLPRGYKVEVQQSGPGVTNSDGLHQNGINLHTPHGTQTIDGYRKASEDNISLIG